VLLRCRACSAVYPPERFIQELDAAFEQELADIRCDRV